LSLAGKDWNDAACRTWQWDNVILGMDLDGERT
jgi:hypothetical protein